MNQPVQDSGLGFHVQKNEIFELFLICSAAEVGFRVQNVVFSVQISGFRVQDSGLWVQSSDSHTRDPPPFT
jgi:hypothetical protein